MNFNNTPVKPPSAVAEEAEEEEEEEEEDSPVISILLLFCSSLRSWLLALLSLSLLPPKTAACE